MPRVAWAYNIYAKSHVLSNGVVDGGVQESWNHLASRCSLKLGLRGSSYFRIMHRFRNQRHDGMKLRLGMQRNHLPSLMIRQKTKKKRREEKRKKQSKQAAMMIYTSPLLPMCC
jgi:hypothetical protein